MKTTPPVSEQGFTLIEVVVTLFVAVGFVIVLNTLCVTIIRASTSAQNQAVAESIAYTNLRRYAYSGATPSTWFTCSSSSDATQTPSALNQGQGQQLSTPPVDSSVTLPQPVVYKITAVAPYGCSGTSLPPVLVRSTVTYGSGNSLVSATQATYVGY